MIDFNFDYSTDTPPNKDPDLYSLTLNTHHRLAWTKMLPLGELFQLRTARGSSGRYLLAFNSNRVDLLLGSDAISLPYIFRDPSDRTKISGRASYKSLFPHAGIRETIPHHVIDFYQRSIGLASYIIFPAIKQGGFTLNQARGVNRKICDRFDLTLECIRRFYDDKKMYNPLGDTLERNRSFFELFKSIDGYVDFFALNDLLTEDQMTIRFWLPFDEFKRSALPQSADEYILYKQNVCQFLEQRRSQLRNLLK